MESPCVSYATKLSQFAKHKPMFFLFRSDAIILLQHFCRAEVQLKTSDEIKNANHGALVTGQKNGAGGHLLPTHGVGGRYRLFCV